MQITRLKLLILLLTLPAALFAGEGNTPYKGKYTKEKRIAKAYYVNSNAALDVSNKFGTVYVTTWDEDKTDIEVLIKISGDSEELVNKRINSIDVDITALKSLVTARTKVGNFSGNKISMEINYIVRIPKNGPVTIRNQYGDIKTGKIYGKTDLRCEYGGLNIEELNNDSNNIHIEYCGTSKLGYMKSGNVTAKYSEFKLSKGKSLSARCEYSQIKVGDIDDITLRCEYGEAVIDKADKLTSTVNYTAIKVGTVNNLCNITCNYGDVMVENIAAGVKNVAVNATYSGIKLKYSENLAFDFEFSTSYGGVNGLNGMKITEKRNGDTDTWYKGYYKSSGNARVFVKTEFGDINIWRN